MTKNKLLIFILSTFCLALTAFAQTSSNYQNKEHVINSGGDPAPTLASANYQITLSSIGDGLSLTAMSSSSYQVDGGFAGSYPPPGEVMNLMFSDKTNFYWDTEPSVGNYNVYRGNVAELTSGYGSCFAQGLTATTASDTEAPPAGQCYFYLVTAENMIAEEGTMGNNSSAEKRVNASPCS